MVRRCLEDWPVDLILSNCFGQRFEKRNAGVGRLARLLQRTQVCQMCLSVMVSGRRPGRHGTAWHGIARHHGSEVKLKIQLPSEGGRWVETWLVLWCCGLP